MAKPDLLKWVSDDAAAKITDPGSTKKLNGFLYKEAPPFQYVNWLFNRIYHWLLGLQGGYYDIVVGSSAQVTAGEATHVITDLNDTLVTAGSKVLLLAGTHTLTANITLTNDNIVIVGENRTAIVDFSTFVFSCSGCANSYFEFNTTNLGANDFTIGSGSKCLLYNAILANISVSGNAVAETAGTGAAASSGINASALRVGGSDVLDRGTAQTFTKQKNFAETTLTDAASITWDLDSNQVSKVTLAGNRTLANPTNMVAGGTYVLRVIQDATGSRTLGYGTAYKWPNGVAPTLSTGANAIDLITFVSDGTNMYGSIQKAYA